MLKWQGHLRSTVIHSMDLSAQSVNGSLRTYCRQLYTQAPPPPPGEVLLSLLKGLCKLSLNENLSAL